MTQKAQIRVAAPWSVPQSRIEDFIQKKASWIIEKRNHFKESQELLQQRRFEHGHEFLFLGKFHKLVIQENEVKKVDLKFDGDFWQVMVPSALSLDQKQGMVKKKLIQWYRQEAQELLGSRVFHYARVMGVEPKTIAIRTQKRVWGNCHYHTKAIHFNWQIIFSPLAVIDYVVVHELAHLIVPNHSKRFWKNVENVLSDFKQHQAWLKEHALELSLP